MNRPFQSSPGPLYQNEVKCSAFDMETIFHCRLNKNSFSQERLCTWPHFESSGKWPIMIDDISLFFLSGCSCALKLSSHILTFKLQRTANEYAAKPWIYKRPDQQNHTLSRHTEFCKADRTTWKLTLQDINTTLKEPKTELVRSRRQLFRPHKVCFASYDGVSYSSLSLSAIFLIQLFPLLLFSVSIFYRNVFKSAKDDVPRSLLRIISVPPKIDAHETREMHKTQDTQTGSNLFLTRKSRRF